MEREAAGDAIHIEELEIAARVGVPDAERANPQRLTVSVTIWPRLAFHEMGDEISGAVDYATVCRELEHFFAARADKLIETLASAAAAHLLDTFPIARVRVELRKFVLPQTRFVAAICERSAE
ncbi:MAG TPA: dihydroneopterin aldolase [Chthoniobacterales bacterium]